MSERKKAVELIMRVAFNIKKFRIQIKLTQEQLESMSGVSVARCESGKQDMTLTTIGVLSEHLSIEPHQLLK